MEGMFAISKAGHDKGKLYIIMKEEEEYVYLSDGVLRPADKLKKKNKKHIQVVKTLAVPKGCKPMELRDEEIKRIIKLYERKGN